MSSDNSDRARYWRNEHRSRVTDSDHLPWLGSGLGIDNSPSGVTERAAGRTLQHILNTRCVRSKQAIFRSEA